MRCTSASILRPAPAWQQRTARLVLSHARVACRVRAWRGAAWRSSAARATRGSKARALTAAGVVLQRARLHAQRAQRAQLLDCNVRLLPTAQPDLQDADRRGRNRAGSRCLCPGDPPSGTGSATRLRVQRSRCSPGAHCGGLGPWSLRPAGAARGCRTLPNAPSPMILLRCRSFQSMSHSSVSSERARVERSCASCRDGAGALFCCQTEFGRPTEVRAWEHVAPHGGTAAGSRWQATALARMHSCSRLADVPWQPAPSPLVQPTPGH